MRNISSQLTLAFKVFFPTIWLTFFATIVGFILLSEDGVDAFGGAAFDPTTVRLVAVGFFVFWALFFYFFFMRLKRVELDEHFLYATNYYKTYRYPFHNIEKLTLGRFLFWRPSKVHLKTPGKFGSKFTFLASNQLEAYLEENPDLVPQLTIEK